MYAELVGNYKKQRIKSLYGNNLGHIVADFMDTGTLTADIIKTGVLESKNGKSWLNMLTGDFNFGDKVKYENGKFEIIVESSSGGNTSLGDELNNMNNKIEPYNIII